MTPCIRAGLALLFLLLPFQAQTAQQASSKPAGRTKAPDSGVVNNGVYRNASFGFSYRIPFGWVDRTEQMNDGSSDPAKGRVLLATFAQPPEVGSDALNPGVVIAMESIATYPGLKTPADYFGPLDELIVAKGFKVVSDAYEVQIGGRNVVRADYSKSAEKRTTYQSCLAILVKGYVVSFTFIAGSEDDVEELVQSLSFAAVPNGKSRG